MGTQAGTRLTPAHHSVVAHAGSVAGALDALRALERRFAEVAEERDGLTAAHEELRGRAARLEAELTAMTGGQTSGREWLESWA